MTFPLRFLICNGFMALLLGAFLLLKKLFRRHMTIHTQYALWWVFLFALALPFLPSRLIFPEWLLSWTGEGLLDGSVRVLSGAAASKARESAQALGITDYALAEAPAVNRGFFLALWGIWGAGMTAAAGYLFRSVRQIRRLRRNAFLITADTEPELYALYASCLGELGIRRKIRLYASCTLESPVSYGIFLPRILVPQDLDIQLSREEIRFIFLHELQHYRHRDALLNSLACLLQILYWFNPLIWYAFSLLRRDREIACDRAVLRAAGQEQRANYGYTLVKYAQKLGNGTFLSPLSGMSAEGKALKNRLSEIVDYRPDSLVRKIKSAGLFLLAAALVYAASPILGVRASDASASLSGLAWEEAGLSELFDGRTGSFVLYDTANNKYAVYNPSLGTKRVSPDSTYKIYSALFALESGVLAADDSTLAWDGTSQPYAAWERDQTLKSAMENSVNWYFQELDARMGLSALTDAFSEISYGNADLSGGISQYWAESSLKISPLEQTQLLAQLLDNAWDCAPKNIQAVKDALYLGEFLGGSLYGKTGTGSTAGQNTNGWFVGFLEKDGNTWTFAANLQAGGSDTAQAAATDDAARRGTSDDAARTGSSSASAARTGGSSDNARISGFAAAQIALEALEIYNSSAQVCAHAAQTVRT